ncbi:hypothetical protein V1504DRAFT_72844 [Lipomyces starkeyi]
MNLANFLNPAEESREEGTVPEKELLQQIIGGHTGQSQDNAGTYDDDDSPDIVPLIPSLPEALHALSIVIRYTERQNDIGTNTLRGLEKYERQQVS